MPASEVTDKSVCDEQTLGDPNARVDPRMRGSPTTVESERRILRMGVDRGCLLRRSKLQDHPLRKSGAPTTIPRAIAPPCARCRRGPPPAALRALRGHVHKGRAVRLAIRTHQGGKLP
jgi:hypothetical protein